MEQARRLAQRGQRVALVCYSHGLASYLERITATWPRRQRPAYVGEFHALGVLWGAPEGPDESLRNDETVQFWEHDLPLQMADLAAQLEPGHRFDSIVVDEAQDFADAWWDPLLAALKDDEAGGIYVFTDEGQRVFNRHGSPPVPLVPLILDHNLRNTRQIANAFQPLVDHPMRFLGGDGPAVKFVACARDDAMDVGDDEVELLLEEGWRPEDVALLTTGSRHPEQTERQAGGHAAYWDSFWDAEQVFYGHVLGFKGLERRAVVLVVNEESAVRTVPRTALRRIVPRPRPTRGVRRPGLHRAGGRPRSGTPPRHRRLTAPQHRRLEQPLQSALRLPAHRARGATQCARRLGQMHVHDIADPHRARPGDIGVHAEKPVGALGQQSGDRAVQVDARLWARRYHAADRRLR